MKHVQIWVKQGYDQWASLSIPEGILSLFTDAWSYLGHGEPHQAATLLVEYPGIDRQPLPGFGSFGDLE